MVLHRDRGTKEKPQKNTGAWRLAWSSDNVNLIVRSNGELFPSDMRECASTYCCSLTMRGT